MPLEKVPGWPRTGDWTVVIPFKGGPAAKSRLGHPAVGETGFRPDMRHRLALAFLADTAAAALAVPAIDRIVVVSSDLAVLTVLEDTVLVADPGEGLNAAVAAGVSWARNQEPGCAVAVLTGDLPCLIPADLAAALDLASRHPRSMVPDRQGTGTTLITALPGEDPAPRFGPGSCRAHLREGHTLLPVPLDSTLRADVDTPADLNQALRRGTGNHTGTTVLRPALRSCGAPSAGCRRPLPAAVWPFP